MDTKQRKLNQLNRLSASQTLPDKEAKKQMKAAGISLTLENQFSMQSFCNAHPMTLRVCSKRLSLWIQRNRSHA